MFGSKYKNKHHKALIDRVAEYNKARFIARNTDQDFPAPINLDGIDRSQLSEIDLSNADLKKANFRGANFTASKFRNTNLPEADFREVKFITVKNGEDLCDYEELDDQFLYPVQFHDRFVPVEFWNADLHGTKFSLDDLSIFSVNFNGAKNFDKVEFYFEEKRVIGLSVDPKTGRLVTERKPKLRTGTPDYTQKFHEATALPEDTIHAANLVSFTAGLEFADQVTIETHELG